MQHSNAALLCFFDEIFCSILLNVVLSLGKIQIVSNQPEIEESVSLLVYKDGCKILLL